MNKANYDVDVNEPEKNANEIHSNAFLEQESIGKLMGKYLIPCIISLLVAALYNIVDQIFIANASYLGSYGNAANTVVFPLTAALAIWYLCHMKAVKLEKDSFRLNKEVIIHFIPLSICSLRGKRQWVRWRFLLPNVCRGRLYRFSVLPMRAVITPNLH